MNEVRVIISQDAAQVMARAKVTSAAFHSYAAVMRDGDTYFVETDERWADAAPRCTDVELVSEYYEGEAI